MMTDDPTYDVAISFLSEDEAIARALFDKLEANGFKVFFYPRRQEELVGTNGLETMRAPFLDARVVVVLFKTRWGQTNWTRVEETAITDRCLERGWDSLIFVNLDKVSTLPKWLPKAHVRFSLPDFGLEQLVGVVTFRVQEQGGTAAPPDAMSEAKRVRRDADYASTRAALMRDRSWIEKTVHQSLRETFREVIRLVEKANTEHGFAIEIQVDDYQSCAMRRSFISLVANWEQPTYATVDDDPHYGASYVRVSEFLGGVIFPGEHKMYIKQPKLLREHRFKVDVSRSLELVWIEQHQQQQVLPAQLANRIVMILLDLISRANAGKIKPPSFIDD